MDEPAAKVRRLEEEEKTFDELPDRVVWKIIRLLSVRERIKMERVCRRWTMITGSTWSNVRRLDMVDMVTGKDPTDFTLTKQVCRAVWTRSRKSLVHLRFNDVALTWLNPTQFLHPSVLWELSRLDAPNLRTLDLSTVRLNPKFVPMVLDSLHGNVETLRMDNCFQGSVKRIGDTFTQSMAQFLKRSVNLKELCLRRIPSSCKFLRTLPQTIVTLALDEAGRWRNPLLSLDEIFDSPGKFPNLRVLDLSRAHGLRISFDKIYQAAPNLVVLDAVYGRFRIVNEAVAIANFHSLQTLKLSGFSGGFGNSFLEAITDFGAPCRHSLRDLALHVEGIQKQVIQRVARLYGIEQLKLGGLEEVNGETIRALAHCSRLQNINFEDDSEGDLYDSDSDDDY